MSPGTRRKKLIKTGNGVTLGVTIDFNATALCFLAPDATHVVVEEHPTQNMLLVKITAEEVIR